MKPPLRIPNLGGARAVVLHRQHPTVQALTRQLQAIGLEVTHCWPDLPDALADFVFFDADMAHDAQFPWTPGAPPMPLIALIGSEAPGRIEAALRIGAHAQLLKPIGDGGAYSALLIAQATREAQAALTAEVADLRRRLEARQTVVRAVTLLAVGMTEAEAYARLRRLAMDWRLTFEDAAARVVAQGGTDGRRNRG
jgi:two-component system, response regulator / RNA-binding antiterminator